RLSVMNGQHPQQFSGQGEKGRAPARLEAVRQGYGRPPVLRPPRVGGYVRHDHLRLETRRGPVRSFVAAHRTRLDGLVVSGWQSGPHGVEESSARAVEKKDAAPASLRCRVQYSAQRFENDLERTT